MRATYLRSDVQSPPFPVRFRSEFRTKFGITVERDIVNNKVTFLAHHINVERAWARGLMSVHVNDDSKQ
jgi:hypothetical protein